MAPHHYNHLKNNGFVFLTQLSFNINEALVKFTMTTPMLSSFSKAQTSYKRKGKQKWVIWSQLTQRADKKQQAATLPQCNSDPSLALWCMWVFQWCCCTASHKRQPVPADFAWLDQTKIYSGLKHTMIKEWWHLFFKLQMVS